MTKNRGLLWIFMMLSLIFVSCVHEYPEDEGIDPTNVDVRLTLSTKEPFQLVSRSNETSGYMHYIVEIYKDDYEGTPVLRKEATVEKQGDGTSVLNLELPLHGAHYKVAAWASIVGDKDGNGGIFATSKLSEVTFVGDYQGNMRDKECYDARFDLDLSKAGWNEQRTVSQELTTPMAGIEIISTDLDVFAQTLIRNAGRSILAADWWSDFYLNWSYDLYFPTSYNVYTGMPNKASTQVAFRSDIKQISDKEASLGYDFVFVNGKTSTQSITLALYNKGNTLLNTYGGINANLERGKLTVIKGEYLTRKHSSGTGIDPEFDGELNIER